jgi:Tfp pilus assembly protein PilO
MKKYLSQLRPLERRLVVGVGVLLLIVLNWMFIWPYFNDWENFDARLSNANHTLEFYRTTIAQMPDLQSKVKKYESEGGYVPPEDQGINLMQTIQQQSAQSGVQLQNFSRPTTSTNDAFFIEHDQNINVLATEGQLVDFLYKLGSSSSMIRVRDLTLQPDPPHQRLVADIKLVASYQKNPTASVPNSSTAKAK